MNPDSVDEARRHVGSVAPLWAIVGVAGLFTWAVVRLGGRGIATIGDGLDAPQWFALVGLTALFVYGEGVLALDRRWVPGLMRRARSLRREPRLTVRLLAPLHGLSLIGVPPRNLLRGWLGTAAIAAAVIVLRSVPDPWRGIIDFAVAAALAWGLAAILRRLPSEWVSPAS